MKQLRTFIYIISLLATLNGIAQDSEKTNIEAETTKDSVSYKQRYGLRVGVDLARLIRSFAETNYRGVEIVADYRLTHRWFIAGEIGNEEKTTEEDWFHFTTTGSYIKLGADWNGYDNWFGMENIISFGFRYGFSTFSQQVDNYTPATSDPFWGESATFEGTNENILGEHSGLNAHWIELVLAMKVELVHNVYLGGSVRLNRMITDKAANNFANLYVPGFNKVTDGSSFGVGYNYSISYLIPLYKKTKKRTYKSDEEKD